MKVLQLCNKPPQPQVDGGCIAINTISNGLIGLNVDLKILTASTEKHPFKSELIDPSFAATTKIEGIFLDTRVNVIDAFSALVTSDSYNVSRFFSADFDKRLREILSETAFDIVHLESLFMTPYVHTIRSCSTAKIILRSHNLEHLLWQRLANSTGNKAKRIYLKHLAARLKKYEENVVREVDGIAAISFDDTNRFRSMAGAAPVITIPFSVKLENYIPVHKKVSELIRLSHIGAMDWEPNKEAVTWLLDEIWPLVNDGKCEIHLAGRKMPVYISELAGGNLFVEGEVASAVEFMNQQDLFVVPLLSGGGMRIKIVEAMALGKAVITTTLGAEGIDCKNGENIFIADSSEEFAAIINRMKNDHQLITSVGCSARKLVEEHYHHETIMKNLHRFYLQILAQE